MVHDEKMKLGMCWFDEEQWNLLKDLDPDGTDDTYSDWRKRANEAFSELRASGQDIVKVSIKIEELLAWCEERGCEPVSSSRSEYAGFRLQQKVKRNETKRNRK